MPPIVLTIVSIINIAAQYAPQAKQLYADARDLFDKLFKGGLITADQQARLMAWAEAHEAATLAGVVPPELTVEPDPA